MSKSNHSEAQMIGALKQLEARRGWKTWRGNARVEAHDLFR
jgi:hypothetical protein